MLKGFNEFAKVLIFMAIFLSVVYSWISLREKWNALEEKIFEKHPIPEALTAREFFLKLGVPNPCSEAF